MLCKFCEQDADEDTDESRAFTQKYGYCSYCYEHERICQVCITPVKDYHDYIDMCETCERIICKNCAVISVVEGGGTCRECFETYNYEFHCKVCKNIVTDPFLPVLLYSLDSNEYKRYCIVCQEKQYLCLLEDIEDE